MAFLPKSPLSYVPHYCTFHLSFSKTLTARAFSKVRDETELILPDTDFRVADNCDAGDGGTVVFWFRWINPNFLR